MPSRRILYDLGPNDRVITLGTNLAPTGAVYTITVTKANDQSPYTLTIVNSDGTPPSIYLLNGKIPPDVGPEIFFLGE